MLLPGPEAMQLATYAGWKLHGTKGGLAAGLLFVLPGALVVLALSMLYAHFGNLPAVEAVFYGIKAAVLAIVIEALLRVARRALTSRSDGGIAALAFLALFCFGLPSRSSSSRRRSLASGAAAARRRRMRALCRHGAVWRGRCRCGLRYGWCRWH